MESIVLRFGRRRLILAIAFVVTLLSAVLAPSQETETVPGKAVRPQGPASTPREPRQQDVEMPVLVNFERALEKKISVVDVFEARAVPGVPAPPPRPVPPKLPFVYQGSIEEAGRTKMVLLEGEQIHIVEKGGSIGTAYRLESINADNLVFTYLPLEIQQALPTGDTK